MSGATLEAATGRPADEHHYLQIGVPQVSPPPTLLHKRYANSSSDLLQGGRTVTGSKNNRIKKTTDHSLDCTILINTWGKKVSYPYKNNSYKDQKRHHRAQRASEGQSRRTAGQNDYHSARVQEAEVQVLPKLQQKLSSF